ncbi:beta-phosphoglucomutase family hydrolase [Georgenia yuyongxinii]|uniref:Beta-phosphoglucomutase n=1 Tax=Georgenia yuyongxinii TaxID=2589797 RepID=A0A5B8C824_9MICO|nr:beta-phosphoglucomutase family hydrolase [Georgenia yuyongxinii]QDC26180.1 beta-phosphoglucomutase family hydrolase [Georgenia yuyongxinii]
MLGLPAQVRACLFDLDGVLTRTADTHRAAWAETFDEFLRARALRTGQVFAPFDPDADYARYVDGKPREDGIRDFLTSRGVSLPLGSPEDRDSVRGLGTVKNERLLRRLVEGGVVVFADGRSYVEAARTAGLACAVVSSSANTRMVLDVAGLAGLFGAVVDGVVAAELALPGKPAPDTFLEGARRLDVEPARCAVFEDALAGVQAGRAGGFGFVVGVDRDRRRAAALLDQGADVVVPDLEELL